MSDADLERQIEDVFADFTRLAQAEGERQKRQAKARLRELMGLQSQRAPTEVERLERQRLERICGRG